MSSSPMVQDPSPTPSPVDRPAPEAIKAVPVRHPLRWVMTAVVIVLAAMFVHMLVTNPNLQWTFIVDNAFRPPVLAGLRGTVLLTITSMLIGVTLGAVLAIMRLSPNPVLMGLAWSYTWFFRAMPRLVLVVLFGNLGILWSRIELGLPFDRQIGALFGIPEFTARFCGVRAVDLLSGFTAAMLALALSEAAYMAEIVRAGIQSVDQGQSEAAAALGMSRTLTMWRIVLPQSMRVIVPTTGNETIAMLKDTAVVSAAGTTGELFFQLQAIGHRTYQVVPMLVAACLWYLMLTSVLLVGQHYLERYFSRGASGQERTRARLRSLSAETGGILPHE